MCVHTTHKHACTQMSTHACTCSCTGVLDSVCTLTHTCTCVQHDVCAHTCFHIRLYAILMGDYFWFQWIEGGCVLKDSDLRFGHDRTYLNRFPFVEEGVCAEVQRRVCVQEGVFPRGLLH